MDREKAEWSRLTAEALEKLAEKRSIDPERLKDIPLVVQKPPKPELGDLAVPLFPFAKVFRCSPAEIAEETAEMLQNSGGNAEAAGGYVNIRISLADTAETAFKKIREEGDAYGASSRLSGTRVMVEFSCPNTNKPLHLGHLRNDSLGESIARILGANGADVRKVNLINDRGIHICKSMLAYQVFSSGSTPETEGKKSDHFVGDYYVKFSQWAKEDPEAETQAQSMLRSWEEDDAQTVALWKTMNRWAVSGIEETYRRTHVSFDEVYYESETYKRGRDEVLKGLEAGVFYQDSEGTVWVDLDEIGLDRKVLLRKDGTSLYLTQDIGTAILRHEHWPFDTMIYVVGSEQQYHFTVLFHVLKKLKYQWAERMYHLSYGMVNLPEGKMKSREGNVVDADDLLDELERMAEQEITEKGREQIVEDLSRTSKDIALGALNYYLLQAAPNKDMVFDPAKSLEFTGNTGPYIQYMGARVCSMLRKYEAEGAAQGPEGADFSLLDTRDERELIKLLGEFPGTVEEAGKQMNPSLIAGYLYELTKTFSRFYHDVPVLKAETSALVHARITLCRGVLQVLNNGCALLGIPFLEVM